MKKTLSLLLALLLTAGLCACGNDGADKQIIFPIDAEPEYLDPQIVADIGSANIIAACFEGLMTYDDTGALVPAAAESYDLSANGKVYTFHLRDDLRWRVTNLAAGVLGDGKADFDKRVTAEDFAFGLRRALWPETNSPAAPYLMAIKNAPAVHAGTAKKDTLGIKAVDDTTLKIRLSHPDTGFLAALTLPGAMPCDETYFNATRGRYGLSAEYFICNGAFYLSNWNAGTAITVRKERKNMDAYHSPSDVKPASVYFSFNNEQATRGTKLLNGTYEAAPLTAAQATELADDKDLTIRAFDNAMFSLLFNCGDDTLKSSAIRRAIAMTYAGDAMRDATGLSKAKGVVPQACLFGTESFRVNTPNVSLPEGTRQRAKELMQSGMDQLEIKEVELMVLCEESLETAVRTVMQQWQSAFGVHFSIAVEAVTPDELRARLNAGEYQLAFATLQFANTTALAALLRFCSGAAGNVVRLQSKTYDALLQKAENASLQAEARAALQEAERYLVSQAVLLPLGNAQTYLGFAKGVSGIGATPTGDILYFKHALHK